MQEVKMIDCKFHEFEETASDMLQTGWDLAFFAPQVGYIVALFIRNMSTAVSDTRISAAPEGVTLGERLRWLRKRSGKTLETVSRFSDISISYLSNLERGRTLPSLPMLYKLAVIYGITASELLRGVAFVFGDKETP